MSPSIKKAATTGKLGLPELPAKLLEELIPGPVNKEQFEDIFQNFPDGHPNSPGYGHFKLPHLN